MDTKSKCSSPGLVLLPYLNNICIPIFNYEAKRKSQ